MGDILAVMAQKNGRAAIVPDENFIENIACGGPGIVAVIRMPDMRILFVNDQFEYYFGYSNEYLKSNQIFFTSFLEGFQLDLLINQLKNVEREVSARSSFHIYRLKGKKDKVQAYLFASPLLNEAKQEHCYHLMMHPDLSKWGMPFTSFETKEIFLEQFNCESFGTFEWIVESDKILWSPGIYKIYEVENSMYDINSEFVDSFIHPNDAIRIREATSAILEAGDHMEVEFKIISAKQNVKIIHCIARVIKDQEGGQLKMVGCIRDITDQRLIEESLKNKVEELNHSNRELEEFAYVASHDIQEPLRKITTFSDRLAEKYKDVLKGDGALYLSRIIASAENMRMLINELLEFSRISKTEQPFEQTKLNFVLRQVLSDLELTIEETGTVINCPELPVVEAIPSQMKQLLSNIVTNAIKFHKPGINPVVTIETRALTNKEKLHHDLLPGETYYEIRITDNGIGFEDEYATRIFQVFQRLHGKSEYPGSGIGLAICKKILEYHHGVIYAENIPGAGARFVFILPRHQQKI